MAATDDLTAELERIAEKARPLADEGHVADYIPAMAELDPHSFGLAASTLDGDEHATGDADEGFAIQSISKVFALVHAMQKVSDDLWNRVGREPSGDPFNSLVQLEHERGIPRNPMINAGAIVVDDVLLGHCQDPKGEILELLADLVGEELGLDEGVARAESRGGERNRGMAYLMASFDNIEHDVDEVLSLYVHQCAIKMSARQLARAVRFLANDGIDPGSGRRVLPDHLARRVNAIMLTCGTYDAAGEFAFSVGYPCKSGVAGGIVGVVPERMGIGVWSPPLDRSGNSRAGREALHLAGERLDLSVF